MRQRHRIILTGEDLRAALIEYMATHSGDSFPSNATIRCLTQSTLKGQVKDERDVVEISWGDEDSKSL